MSFNRVAAALVALLFCYYEVFRWIPLARWNWQFSWPVVNDQFYPDIIIGGLLLLFVLVFFEELAVAHVARGRDARPVGHRPLFRLVAPLCQR